MSFRVKTEESRMAEKLLQHKHCRNCGKAVPADDTFCDAACKGQHTEMMRKKKNQMLFMMFIAVAMMVFALLSG